MPIYEYECTMCGGISEFLEGMTEEQSVRECGSCGSEDLKKTLSKCVQSRTGYVMGSQGGKTCCGREERCDTVPCAQGETCHK
jgi:putative FmdB family regulatory protein